MPSFILSPPTEFKLDMAENIDMNDSQGSFGIEEIDLGTATPLDRTDSETQDLEKFNFNKRKRQRLLEKCQVSFDETKGKLEKMESLRVLALLQDSHLMDLTSDAETEDNYALDDTRYDYDDDLNDDLRKYMMDNDPLKQKEKELSSRSSPRILTWFNVGVLASLVLLAAYAGWMLPGMNVAQLSDQNCNCPTFDNLMYTNLEEISTVYSTCTLDSIHLNDNYNTCQEYCSRRVCCFLPDSCGADTEYCNSFKMCENLKVVVPDYT